MLSVENLSLMLGERSLFGDVSFRIGNGEKVGLVGVNGAGKSTLLRVIAGQVLPDRGRITGPPRVGYLRQDPRVAFPSERSVIECLFGSRGLLELAREIDALARAIGDARSGSPDQTALIARYGRRLDEWEARGGYEAEPLARRLLDGLGLGHVGLEQSFGTLSGGQKTRLALAALLFSQPDILLLDEPTNHLDRAAAGWLMDFIADFSGAVLIVSHDLALLDRAISRVLHIDERNGRVEVYRGNYSAFVRQRDERRAQAERDARIAERQIQRLQVTADRWRATPTRVSQAKLLDRRVERLREAMPERAAESRAPKLRLGNPPTTGKVALEVSDLWKSYGDTLVLADLRFEQSRGQRIALLGSNGAGKSTLLKVLAQRLVADAGRVRYGHNVRVGYYAQEHEVLDRDATVLEEARRSAAVAGGQPPTDGQLRTALGSFLFSGAKVRQTVGTLSGGERSRLALAKLFIEGANLLLLDEPTNNLDLASQESLLRALQSFSGSMIIVCHLSEFVARLSPERALLLPNGECVDFRPDLLALDAAPRRRRLAALSSAERR